MIGYALFKFEQYYPSGGASDFCDLYDTLEDAEQALNKTNDIDRANVARIVVSPDHSLVSFELVANYQYTDSGIDSVGRTTYSTLNPVMRWIKTTDEHLRRDWQEL